MIPKQGTSYHLTIQADGNQQADSGLEQLNYRTDGSQSSSSRREQNGGFHAPFPRYLQKRINDESEIIHHLNKLSEVFEIYEEKEVKKEK